jgi:hypothetical protein
MNRLRPFSGLIVGNYFDGAMESTVRSDPAIVPLIFTVCPAYLSNWALSLFSV